MSMSDPLGDMLTRIRNGQHARKTVVSSPSSRFRTNVLEVLKREGYIRNYSRFRKSSGCPGLVVVSITASVTCRASITGLALPSCRRLVVFCLTMRRAQPRLAAKSSVTYFKERLACLVSEAMRLPFLLM